MKTIKIALLTLLSLGLLLFTAGCEKENTPPAARFSVTPGTGNSDTVFQFDAGDCCDAEDETSVLLVHWDWTSDGIWDTDFSSYKTVSHQFPEAGEYTVILEVKDTRGLRNAISKKVLVIEPGSGNFTDVRDGHSYQWVRIGQQVWMAENLAYLPEVYPSYLEYPFTVVYNVYGYEGTRVADAKINPNFATYGVLYDWEASMSACPDGWHLPGESEWMKLLLFLGDSAGGKMKEAGPDHWKSPNTGATNSSGFTARPAGGRNNQGGFATLGDYTTFWSSTECKEQYSFVWRLSYDKETAIRLDGFRRMGFSVRCIRN